MAFAKKLTSGADLTHPRATPGWILGAMVAIALLIGVFLVVKWGIGQITARTGMPAALGGASTKTPDGAGFVY